MTFDEAYNVHWNLLYETRSFNRYDFTVCGCRVVVDELTAWFARHDSSLLNHAVSMVAGAMSSEPSWKYLYYPDLLLPNDDRTQSFCEKYGAKFDSDCCYTEDGTGVLCFNDFDNMVRFLYFERPTIIEDFKQKIS